MQHKLTKRFLKTLAFTLTPLAAAASFVNAAETAAPATPPKTPPPTRQTPAPAPRAASASGTAAPAPVPAARPAASANDAADDTVRLDAVVVEDIPAEQSILPTRPSQSLYGFEETIRETPRSVFQISKTQLSNDVIQNFTDFSRYSPSIQRGAVSPYSAPRIRGGTADTLRNNIVLFNTVVRPFNTNAWESADIVAGVPSVVQGNTSRTAGYVNYITKKPFFDGAHTEFTANFGRLGLTSETTYPQYTVQLDHSNVLIKDELAFRISLLQSQNNLYWANSEADTQDLFAAVAWRPNSKVTVDVNFTYTKSSGAIPLGINRLTQNLIDNWTYNAQTYRPIYGFGGVNYTLNAAGTEFVGANGTTYAIGNVPWTQSSPATLAGWAKGPDKNVKIRGDQTISGQDSDNNANEYIAQIISSYKVNDVFTLRNNTVFQYSENIDKPLDLQSGGHVNKLFETRFELLSNKEFSLFGKALRHQSNSGFSFRFLSNTCDGFAPIGAATPVTYADATQGGDYSVLRYLGGSPSDYLGKLPATTGDYFVVADTAYGPITWIPSAGYGGIFHGVAVGDNSGIGNRVNLGGADRRTNLLKTTNFFSEHKLDVGDNFTWRIGGRLSYVSDSIETNALTRRLVAAGYYSGLNLRDSATATNGDINTSLTVKPLPWISAYVAFDYNISSQDCGCCQTQGFTGALNTLSDSYFDVNTKLYEIGAKFEIIQNKLFANIAWFHQTREVPVANIFTGALASNELIYQGLELSAAWQPTAHTTLGANYSYIDASYKATTGRYPGSPLNSVNLWASYRFDNGFGVKASLWAASSWNANDAGTLRIPAQYGVDAGFFYTGSSWRLDVDVLNLTDEKNWAAAGGLGGNAYTYLLPAERLGLRAKFTYSF